GILLHVIELGLRGLRERRRRVPADELAEVSAGVDAPALLQRGEAGLEERVVGHVALRPGVDDLLVLGDRLLVVLLLEERLADVERGVVGLVVLRERLHVEAELAACVVVLAGLELLVGAVEEGRLVDVGGELRLAAAGLPGHDAELLLDVVHPLAEVLLVGLDLRDLGARGVDGALQRVHLPGELRELVGETVDAGAEVGAVPRQHLGRFVDRVVELLHPPAERLLLRLQTRVEVLDLLLHDLALVFGRRPEAAGRRSEDGQARHSMNHSHTISTRRSFAQPLPSVPLASDEPLGTLCIRAGSMPRRARYVITACARSSERPMLYSTVPRGSVYPTTAKLWFLLALRQSKSFWMMF